ncbi:uncharacterized protein LOC144762046 [Lissotriton helveticus]
MESGVRRTYNQATHRWSDVLDREQDLLHLLGIEIHGLAPPRGKKTTTEMPAEQGGQDWSSAGSSAGPSVITTSDAAPPTTSAGTSSAEASTPGTDAAVPQVPPGGAAVRDGSAAADGDAPQKLSRKEMAVRARARKLEAICAEYRRLWAREQEEEPATTASSSSAPGATSHQPPVVRHCGPPASPRRRGAATKTAAPPKSLDGTSTPSPLESGLPGAHSGEHEVPAPGLPQRDAGPSVHRTPLEVTVPCPLFKDCWGGGNWVLGIQRDFLRDIHMDICWG